MSRPATTRLKVNAPLGSPPTLEWRAVGELKIDPEYQRSILAASSQSLIRRIAQFWDWGLCQPLAVAKRPDGSLTVVDGQHRLEAAKLRSDIAHLPCVITSYANAGDEAAAFVALNQQRRPLTKLDLFKAALAAEDETAVTIARLLDEAGLTLAPHTNYTFWKPGMLANIARIEECYRNHGEKITAASLEAVARGFQGQILRFIGTIFPGIFRFLAEQKREGRVVSRSQLAEALNSLTQPQWKSRIAEEQARLECRYQTAAKVAVATRYASLSPLPSVQPPPPKVEVGVPAKPFPGEAWCDQCDMRVGAIKVANCQDKFCALKKRAAA